MTYTQESAQTSVKNRGKRLKLNHETVSMRLSSEAKHELENLAENFGCIYGGKPWIAKLLTQIADRKIWLVERPEIIEQKNKTTRVVAFRIVVLPIIGTLALLTKILYEEFNVNIISSFTNYIDNDEKCEIYIYASVPIKIDPWDISTRLKDITIDDIQQTIVGDNTIDSANDFFDEFNTNIEKSFPKEFNQFNQEKFKTKVDLIQGLSETKHCVFTISYAFKIELVAHDRGGLAADLYKTVSKYGGSILTSKIVAKDNFASIQVIIQLSKINNNFTKIIEEIKAIRGIKLVLIDDMEINHGEKIPLR